MNPSSRERATLCVIRTEDVNERLRSEIVQVCLDAHGLQDFQNLFLYLPADGLHVIALEAERVVGHAVVTTRWLQPGSRPLLRTAYVDAVSTVPAAQGSGVGRAVMECLATSVSAYEIACLETEAQHFYRRLGWEEWRGPLAGRSEHRLIPTPNQEGIMILRLESTPELDLDEQLTIEATERRIW